MFDRRLISNFDWTLFLASLLLSVLGAVNLYSAGSFSLHNSTTPFYLKQLYWLLAGLFLFFVIISIDYQLLARYSYLLHGSSLFLLLSYFSPWQSLILSMHSALCRLLNNMKITIHKFQISNKYQ